MAASLSDILASLQNGVQALNNLTATITGASSTFTLTGLSTIAPSAGAVTFNSSQAATFISVITSSGATFSIPVY